MHSEPEAPISVEALATALAEAQQQIAALTAERDEAVRHYGHACAAVDHAVTAIQTVVHTIGGTVEGAPTHRGNYLQRLRQLLDCEKAHAEGLR